LTPFNVGGAGGAFFLTSSGGTKRNAAFGTSSASLIVTASISAVAVMPGRSNPPLFSKRRTP
jgi:uncharacterized membrane protein YfcA